MCEGTTFVGNRERSRRRRTRQGCPADQIDRAVVAGPGGLGPGRIVPRETTGWISGVIRRLHARRLHARFVPVPCSSYLVTMRELG